VVWGALITVGCFAGLAILLWIKTQPVRGIYLAFAANGFLMTPNLPVVQERVAAPELIMVLTWTAMAFNQRGWWSQRMNLLSTQRTSLMLAGGFAAAAFLSFFINNLMFYDALAASAVQTVNYAYGFLMFATVVKLVDDWEKWSGCLIAWICGAALVSVVGVYALTATAPAWAYSELGGRISSTLKFENQVPSFLLPILPAVIFLTLRRDVAPRWRVLLALLLPAMIATAVGSGSRTALGMLAVCLIGTVWIAVKEARRRAFSILLMAQVGFVLLSSLMLLLAHNAADYELSDPRPHEAAAWERGWVMIAEWWKGERPFDDTRFGQIALAFDKLPDFLIFGTGPAMFTPRFRYDEVHNTYIGVLIETGLVGFIVLAAWLVHVLDTSWRSVGNCESPTYRIMISALLVGFVALLAYGLFMFGLRQRNIWLLAGLLMALPRLNAASRMTVAVAPRLSKFRHARVQQRFG
jgi:hypothetical protein